MKNKLLLLCVALVVASLALSAWAAEKKQPICVGFFFHFESSPIRGMKGIIQFTPYSGSGPSPYSVHFKNAVDFCERHGIKIEMCTTPFCLQQLYEDFPDVVEKMKQMKLPITRYPDLVGHFLPAPAARLSDIPDFAYLPLEEQVKAEWMAETHTLVPSWHFEGDGVYLGNPRVGLPITLDELPQYHLAKADWQTYGGMLAVQKILGVTQMDPFQPMFKNLVAIDQPETRRYSPVRTAVGANSSFEPSYYPGEGTLAVPEMGNIEGLKWLAENWPRDKAIQIRVGWSALNIQASDSLVQFLKEHPEDFRIIWPDPEMNQWKPESAPLEFYKKKYGVKSLEDVYNMPCPVDKIMAEAPADFKARKPLDKSRHTGAETDWRKRMMTDEEIQQSLPESLRSLGRIYSTRKIPEYFMPKTKSYSQKQVEALATKIIAEAGSASQPVTLPRTFAVDSAKFSLSDAYQSLLFYLDNLIFKMVRPDSVTVGEILGPVDYFETAEEYASQAGTTDDMLNEVDFLQFVYLTAKQVREEGKIPAFTRLLRQEGTTGRARAGRELQANASEFMIALARMVNVVATKGLPEPILFTKANFAPETALSAAKASPAVALNAYWSDPARELKPSTKSIPIKAVAAAAVTLVHEWPVPVSHHDGNFGGPPDYVKAGDQKLSLGQTFLAFAQALQQFKRSGALPKSVDVAEVIGPVDYPMYQIDDVPKYDPLKYRGGWLPREVDPKYLLERERVALQGLPVSGDAPRHFTVAESTIFDALPALIEKINATGHIPGIIDVTLPGQGERSQSAHANPTEFLYGMAQMVWVIDTTGKPRQIVLTTARLIQDQRSAWVGPYSPATFALSTYRYREGGNIWKEKVPLWRINRAWTYAP